MELYPPSQFASSRSSAGSPADRLWQGQASSKSPPFTQESSAASGLPDPRVRSRGCQESAPATAVGLHLRGSDCEKNLSAKAQQRESPLLTLLELCSPCSDSAHPARTPLGTRPSPGARSRSRAAHWLSDTEKLLSYNPGTPPNPPGRPVSWQFPVCWKDPRVKKQKPPKASSTLPVAHLAGSRNSPQTAQAEPGLLWPTGGTDILDRRKGKCYFGRSQLFCCGQTTMFHLIQTY